MSGAAGPSGHATRLAAAGSSAAAALAHPAPRRATSAHWDRLRTLWQRHRHVLLAAFTLAIIAFVIWQLQRLDWAGAWRAAKMLPPTALAAAALTALIGHLNYAGFDVLARRWLALLVSPWRMGWAGSVSYAFTLNFGSMIGGAAVRWRLLSAAGVDAADTTRVVSLAVLTNWLGYALITGLLLVGGIGADVPAGQAAAGAAVSPVGIEQAGAAAGALGHDVHVYAQHLLTWLNSPAARWTGVALLSVALAWMVLLSWHGPVLRRMQSAGLQPPAPWLPLGQLALGAFNWLWMAGVMGCLLTVAQPDPVPLSMVLCAQVLASLAGLVARVPGGLGVIEAVYLALLGGQVETASLLGALLVFRALYFVLPLVLALPGFWLLTRRAATPHP